MGDAWLRLGVAAAAAAVGYMVAGPYGAQIGFLAGSVLGSMIFPQTSDVKMPKIGEYPVQTSNKGIPVPIVYGTVRVAGNVLWMGDLQPYTIKHSSGGGGKGIGGDDSVSEETRYLRTFLIGVCEGPAHISRCWKGKTEINTDSFTQYSGEANTGISALLGESYAEYKNVCCVYFENYELGNSQALPNFVFEVRQGAVDTIFFSAGGTTGRKYRVNDDGTVTQLAAIGSVHEIGRSFSPSRLYSYWGGTFTCYDQDLVKDTTWQTNGELVVPGGINYFDVDFYGNICVVGGLSPGAITLLDADGDVVWTRFLPGSSVYTFCCSFSLSGDILVGTQYGVAPRPPGAYMLSRADGSILHQYNEEPTSGTVYEIRQSPVNKQVILLCSYKAGNQYKVIAYPETGGGEGDEEWLYSLDLPFGFYPSSGLYISDDGKVWVGTRFCTPHGQSVHWLSSGGAYLGGFKTDSVDLGAHDISYVHPLGICVGSHLGVNEEGDLANLAIFDIDFNYIRGFNLAAHGALGEVRPFVYAPMDANPSDAIYDLLTNTRYGAGISASDINAESFVEVRNYCEGNLLKISLSINKQKPLWDWVDYICSHFGGYRYRSGGKICLGVFKDESTVFDLTRDNLAVPDSKDSSPPVQIRKRKYTETFNRIEIQWTDKEANYDTSVAVANDEVDQRISSQVRKKTINLAGITNPIYAQKMAYRMLIESMYRHSFYAFTLAYKNMLLEVNDVGTLTDGFLLTTEKIRITSVSEDKDGRGLSIEAVEDGSRLYPDILYSSQQTERIPPVAATLINARIVFRENVNDRYLHLSIVPGNASVNGYNIYRSYDDSSYEFLGRATIDGITGGDSNSYGILQNNLPAYPSVVYRGGERLVVDIGTVTDFDTSITDDAFFDGNKILKIGDELIGYHNCVETSVAGVWEITGLIRGMHNTLPIAHSPGEAVGTLDIDFTYIMAEADVGKTVYFKAQVFYGNQTQDISGVTAYSHSVSGKYLKPLPVSLMRINGREGLTTYKTNDVTLDWYFCSKISGFGRGGYGNALWGAYAKDPLLEQLKVELEEEDGTPITDAVYLLSDFAEPTQLEILEADRNGKNPIRVKMIPGSYLWSDETRDILIEKI